MDSNFPDLEALGFCDEDVVPGAMCKDGIWQIYDHERFEEWWYSSDSDVLTAKVYVGNTVVSAHYFRLPKVGDPQFYQTVRSWNCFRHREQKKCSASYEPKNASSKVRTLFRLPADRQMDRVIQLRLESKFEDIMDDEQTQKSYHKTLWDVYKAIGYDYKKQKYDKELYEQSTSPTGKTTREESR